MTERDSAAAHREQVYEAFADRRQPFDDAVEFCAVKRYFAFEARVVEFESVLEMAAFESDRGVQPCVFKIKCFGERDGAEIEWCVCRDGVAMQSEVGERSSDEGVRFWRRIRECRRKRVADC